MARAVGHPTNTSNCGYSGIALGNQPTPSLGASSERVGCCRDERVLYYFITQKTNEYHSPPPLDTTLRCLYLFFVVCCVAVTTVIFSCFCWPFICHSKWQEYTPPIRLTPHTPPLSDPSSTMAVNCWVKVVYLRLNSNTTMGPYMGPLKNRASWLLNSLTPKYVLTGTKNSPRKTFC